MHIIMCVCVCLSVCITQNIGGRKLAGLTVHGHSAKLLSGFTYLAKLVCFFASTIANTVKLHH